MNVTYRTIKAALRWFVLPVLLALGVNHGALAACTVTTANPDYIYTLPSTLTVARNAPVGTVILSYAPPGQNNPTASGTCPVTAYAVDAMAGSWTTTSVADVYATNVPGIGIKVLGKASNHPVPLLPTVYQWSGSATGPFSGYWDSFGYQLVVTGPVSPGTLSFASPVASMWLSTSTTALVDAAVVTNLQINGTTNIVARACTTPDVTVNLGNHLSSEFSGVGSKTSSTSFNIALNGCPSGLNTIQYQIDPVTSIVSGTGNTVVALNSGSTANRVGVQLLDGNGNPLALSSPITFSGYSSSTGGDYTIPLKARYYQIDTPVGPGSANTSMIFTMTYQ
ncbi:Fimbrial protein (plasmid) [Cupriavidus metallidurans CH34]|uniref:Fimbrial protein n=2 Tax=Cupriavidus metallidurans TaxID=119219 RepID=Q1LFF7_CUPMC|nr:Fimbrial protein [Cupriavidus metallidurans CH34]